MRFKHLDVDIEIQRTPNAEGVRGLPSSKHVKDELVKYIHEMNAQRVEFDGVENNSRNAQVLRFLLDGKPLRITNYRYCAMTRRYYT